MPDLPVGTVTFLFTDIEGSTKLWEQYPEAMRLALARHDIILREAVAVHNGHIVKTTGDGFCCVFALAPDAVAVALNAQRALHSQTEEPVRALPVRMALHTGTAEFRDGDYYGGTLNRVARLMAAGHGGQTLLSAATQELVRDYLPEGVGFKDLGEVRLRDLQRPERVFQLLHPDLPADFPALRSLNTLPNNLPQQLTSFIGREKEIDEVRRLFTTTRLLTLTGSGGCGKTRLSLQVAADLLEEFPDGVWLVELASLSESALVVQTAAQALGINEEPGVPLTQTLLHSLKTHRLLLVLDNCEHLLQACASLADTLLRACPNVHILASSREPMGIAGELAYRVPSLSLPDPKQMPPVINLTQYEAVRLFIDRAVFSRASFAVTNANAPAIAQLCHRLDGIPLAIELAAVRVKMLPVEQIAARLDDRFRLLTGGSRTALPRQQTLRATLDWSYDLLSDQEKIVLRRLSVFAGGWLPEAADAVCSGEGIEETEVFDLLSGLVDKSLVTYEEQEDQARYHLLETIRQYAQERLLESGEAAEVRRRHRDYYRNWLQDTEKKITGVERIDWYRQVDCEHDNLRAALESYQTEPGEEEAGASLASAMFTFWRHRGYWREGRDWLTTALSQVPQPTALRAEVLSALGDLATWQSDFATARSLVEECLVIRRELGDEEAIANALNDMANIYLSDGNLTMEQTFQEEALSIWRKLDNKKGMAGTLQQLAQIARHRGDFDTACKLLSESREIIRHLNDAKEDCDILISMGNMEFARHDYAAAHLLFEESLTLARSLGNAEISAHALAHLGDATARLGDYAAARANLEDSLKLFRTSGDKWHTTYVLGILGYAARFHGDYATAHICCQECLTMRRELGSRRNIALALSALASTMRCSGEYVAARAYSDELLSLRRELEDEPGIGEALHLRGRIDQSQGDYASAHQFLEQSLAIFRRLDRKSSAADVLRDLGTTAFLLDDAAEARGWFKEGLALKQENGEKHGIASLLEGYAALAVRQKQAEKAVRWYGASEALREAIFDLLSDYERQENEKYISTVRTALSEQAFRSAWAAGRTLSSEQAISLVLADTDE